jgi:hypothetical protein
LLVPGSPASLGSWLWPGPAGAGADYDRLALAGALWSLGWAARAWLESVEAALAAGVVLQHAARGAQRAEDVARNNAHDAFHHLWDVDRILRHATA